VRQKYGRVEVLRPDRKLFAPISAHLHRRRSQLEGLLEVVPPSPPSAPPLKPRCGIKTATLASPATSSASVSTATEAASEGPVPAGSMLAGSGAEDGRAANASYDTETRRGNVAQEEGRGVGVCGGNVDGEIDVEVEGGGGGGGGGIEEDERRGEDVDETKRRFSAVEVSLRASRKEAMEARRARDAAESTVRQQREDLTRLKERVSELEASLEREQEAGKVCIVFNCMPQVCSLTSGCTGRELEDIRSCSGFLLCH